MMSPATGPHWTRVAGVVVTGYGVASGRSYGADEQGTIARQIPHFQKLGLDLTAYHPATINVSIAPRELTIHSPEFIFRQVAWTEDHGPEDFSFSRCKLEVAATQYTAWLYYPHPETKPGHLHPPTLAEIISPFIGGIAPGSRIQLLLDPTEVRVSSEE